MVWVDTFSFGKVFDPLTNKLVPVSRYVLTNTNSMAVTILDLGATVQSIKVPDKFDKIDDVCLGFDNVRDYVQNKKLYMGATLGRVAHRVENGKFCMCGNEVQVTKNYQDKYQLNGGFNGFDSIVWQLKKTLDNGIVLRHVNPDQHEGYPGRLTVTITFTLDESNTFSIQIEATSNKTTPVNITNQIYLNLAGHAARKEAIAQHNIVIKSKEVVETDNNQFPTGAIMPVIHTPYDLQKFTNLGKRLNKFMHNPVIGFDHSYCLCDNECLEKYVAKIIHPCTGRFLEVYTNQEALHFYTANNLPDLEKCEDPIKGKNRSIYGKHGSFCFQPGRYPDSLNHSNFPDITLKPREKYCQVTIFKFGVYK